MQAPPLIPTWLLLLPVWLCIFFFKRDKLRLSCSFSAGIPLPLPAAIPDGCSLSSALSPPLYIVFAFVASVNAPVDGLGIICSPLPCRSVGGRGGGW